MVTVIVTEYEMFFYVLCKDLANTLITGTCFLKLNIPHKISLFFLPHIKDRSQVMVHFIELCKDLVNTLFTGTSILLKEETDFIEPQLL